MKGSACFSLTMVVCLCIAVASVFGQTETRVSAPYTHKNLTIFLIHGKDASSSRDLLTLQEAMEMNVFKVYETETGRADRRNISPTLMVHPSGES